MDGNRHSDETTIAAPTDLPDIGLRQSDVPVALLSFNLGVEVGQMAFCRRFCSPTGSYENRSQPGYHASDGGLAYALGTVATMWFVGRLPGIWGI